MERGGVAAARALCKGLCVDWWPQGEGVRCSDCAGNRAPRSLVASPRSARMCQRARDVTSCSAQPWGCCHRDICPPDAQGTAITHPDGWCGLRAHPEPAKHCPISLGRKVVKENEPAQRSKEEMIPELEG